MISTGDMRTRSGLKQIMSASEVAARVSALAPKFLEGLAPREIAEVLGAAKLQQYRANSLLAREGDRADTVFLVLEGRARTFTTGGSVRGAGISVGRPYGLFVEYRGSDE